MKCIVIALLLCSCAPTRKAAHRKVQRLVEVTAKRDTILADSGLLVYEYADSLYVVRMDSNKVVHRYVVNKGYTWKQLFTITLIALTVGIFIHYFIEKL